MRTRFNAVVLSLAVLAILDITLTASGEEREAPVPRLRAEVEAVLAKAPKPVTGEQLPVLHVVLLADDKDHGPGAHDYPLWQQRWALLLGGRQAADESVKQVNLFGPPTRPDQKDIFLGAANVKVTKAWQWPSKEQFETADLIVMQCYRSGGPKRTWNDERIDELEAYLARGGGFVVVHPATYTLRDLSRPGGRRVAALTGLAFDGSIIVRHGPVKLRTVAQDHPICWGLPETIDLIDEPYWPPIGELNKVTVLAVSDESIPKGSDDLSPQPMFWTAHHGKGRIFGCVPGHFIWTFDDPYFRILLLRGMAWAAGQSPYRFDSLVTRGVRLQ
ncbi:MAG: ThuA domain-containing protein [Planctomycetota bacterium]|jgi:type 1 glutamine amidotransferase